MSRLRLVLMAAVVPLVLAGCADDPEPRVAPSPTPTPSTSATPTADASVEPTLPPEAEGNDEAAAEAFVRYYYDLINYAERTGDVKALRALALPSCAGCRGGADFVSNIYSAGGFIRSDGYTVDKAKVELANETSGARTFNAKLNTSKPPTTQKESSSAETEEFGADTSTVYMVVTWDRTGFSVGSMDFE